MVRHVPKPSSFSDSAHCFGTLPHTSMTPQDFLELVLPRQGVKLICSVSNGWSNHPSDSFEILAETAVGLTAKAVYHALGGYAEGVIKRHEGRSAANVQWLRSFWLDIDAGPGKPYPTKRDAAAALYGFASNVGLPEPLVINSGGGLHAYWPLDADVAAHDWQPVAEALKAATLSAQFKVDQSRTADKASVLRPVGSMNRKRDPAVVVKSHPWTGTPVSLAVIAAALKATPSVLPAPFIFTPSAAPSQTQELAALAGREQSDKSAKRVIENCRQIHWAFNHMGDGTAVSEPLWRACLSVMSRCKDGNKKAHKFSEQYSGYSYAETQKKLDLMQDMPYRCEKFSEANPGKCQGCKHEGKIGSPIVLGIVHAELPAAQFKVEAEVIVPSVNTVHGFDVVTSTSSQERPSPGWPYKRSAKGISIEEQVPAIDPESGKVIPNKFTQQDRIIAPYDIAPMYITEGKVNEMTDSSFSSYWEIIPVHDKELKRTVQLKNADIAKADTLRSKLAEKSAYAANDEQHKGAHRYMLHYLQKLDHSFVHREAKHFGWQEDVDKTKPLDEQDMEFITGRTRYYRRKIEGAWTVGHEEVAPTPDMATLAAVMKSSGTLEDWAKGAAWYKESYASRHIACVLLGAASPFMRFVKKESMVVLARGQAGVGKSHLQRLIASIWASPDQYNKGGFNTVNAAETTAAKLKNLTICMDDKLGSDRDSMREEIMMLANGKGKGRATMTANGKVDTVETSSWSAVTVMSSNDSWIEMLGSKRYDNEGPFARLYEFDIPRISKDAWPVAGTRGEMMYTQLVESNYGLVGPLLIREFLGSPQKAVDKILKFEDTVIEMINNRIANGDKNLAGFDPSNFRLHISLAAVAMYVLWILRRHKLVEWNYLAFLNEIASAISDMGRLTNDARPAKSDLLSQFINENHGSFVVVTGTGTSLSGVKDEDAALGRVPLSKVVGRIDYVENLVYLDRAVFKGWLSDHGVAESGTLQGLQTEGWTVRYGQNVRATIGRGFPLLSKVQTRVIELRGIVGRIDFDELGK